MVGTTVSHYRILEKLGAGGRRVQVFIYFTGYPGFDPLRNDPRFKALQERLALPPA